jgi:glycyl-tRNA synthetase
MHPESGITVPVVEMEKIVSLCKRRGFVFQSSEIYGGIGSTWDYGPLGAELKKSLKEAWWRSIVYERDDMVGLDAAILMHPETWIASGHVAGFSDPLVDCRNCKKRFRADDINGIHRIKNESSGSFRWVYDEDVKCPDCGGKLTEPREFNLMFRTFMGPVEDSASVVYMRPETAQGIFVNFSNILMSTRKKLPFGVAQIGKAFRNEITPGNFIFRSREFEQMEIEYFVRPGTDEEWHKHWIDERLNWYVKYGIKKDHLRLREHGKGELAHYAKSCFDIEYLFPMGWHELEGIANRTDFDLRQHSGHSGNDLAYYDDEAKERLIPYVIEPSGGVDRATLAFLIDAYREEEVRGEKRVVLGFHKALAPVKVAVLPLLRNRPQIVEMAVALSKDLKSRFNTTYDDTASIGRLYRRQDEIGTLFCVTVDVQSLEDKAVTIRDRDTMAQVRISLDSVKKYILEKLEV